MKKERNIQADNPRVIQAIELYKSGSTTKFICNTLRMDWFTLKKFLAHYGIERRTRNEAVRRGKSVAVINDAALDILTPDALYWIGFLYADGHIEKDRPRVSLTLSAPDRKHLDKFAAFFGNGIPITHTVKKGIASNGYTSDDAFRVQFSSTQIHARLSELGFTNRKTWSTDPPHEVLKHSRDFWRGVVDGDESLFLLSYKGVPRYPGIGLCGQERTLVEFQTYMEKMGVHIGTAIRKNPKREFLWEFSVSCKVALNIAKVLYKDASVYLDRKYEKYLSWIDPNNEINKKLK